MSTFGFLLGTLGGIACLIGGTFGDVSPEITDYLTKQTHKHLPDYADFIIAVVSKTAEMGGLSIIIGSFVAYFFTEIPGRILMFIGFASGLPAAAMVMYTGIEQGALEFTMTSVRNFALKQGLGFIGVIMSFSGFIFIRKTGG